jgi:hypothetical protein
MQFKQYENVKILQKNVMCLKNRFDRIFYLCKKTKYGAKISLFTRHIFVLLHKPQKIMCFS